MQTRHTDRKMYFRELATTSQKYFMPYIERWHTIGPATRVLEVGCGDGGNLLPFAQRGCHVTGVDRDSNRIADARSFFAEMGQTGNFIASDIFTLQLTEHSFDIILCHDVLEHVEKKELLLSLLSSYKQTGGGSFYRISCLANAIRRTPANLS